MSWLSSWWKERLKNGFFFRKTVEWPGEDRLDKQKPIEHKDTPLWRWLNRGRK